MAGIPFAGLSVAFVVSAIVSRVHASRRANAMRYVPMLGRIAELTGLSATDVSLLLDETDQELARWQLTGVRVDKQLAVADLLRAAMALRRRMPAPMVGRLLMLRQRLRGNAALLDEAVAALSSRSTPRHLVITARE